MEQSKLNVLYKGGSLRFELTTVGWRWLRLNSRMMALTWSSEYSVLGTCTDRLPASTYPGDAKEPGDQQLSTCSAGPPLGARRFREGGRGIY